MGITTAVVGIAGVAALKTKRDRERRKRERKLREEKERNEKLMLGFKRERDSLEQKKIEQEMLAQYEEQRKNELFSAQLEEAMAKSILDE